MAHSRDDSLSSLTSISSDSFIKTYDSLKEQITSIKNSEIHLQQLTNDAEKIINETFAPHPKSTFIYKKASTPLTIQLDNVMNAMLVHAEESGGEEAKRYVASAIVACGQKEHMIEALEAVGVTWLTHLLFIC